MATGDLKVGNAVRVAERGSEFFGRTGFVQLIDVVPNDDRDFLFTCDDEDNGAWFSARALEVVSGGVAKAA